MRRSPAFSVILTLSLVLGWRPSAAQEQEAGRVEQALEAAGFSGGLIVHLGCGDGRLTSAMGRSGRYIVHGLDRDPEKIATARRRLSEQGIYGRVSAARLRGDRLPYVNQLVNLLLVDDPLGVDRREQIRVLAPRGVLLVRQGDRWNQEIKPWPDELDEWTHFLHGPDNNAVAKDRVVGPPRHLQWIAAPRHLRSHEHLNSLSALVSARGRIFYIIDDGPTAAVALPPQWRLAARDAFNGALLWKRDLGPWEGHFRLFRSGPPDIARRLVAVGDRVYATLGYGKRVAAFDAATGETVRMYDGTEGALEVVVEGDRLFVLTGRIDPKAWREAARRYYPTPPARHKAVVALDAKSGRRLWSLENSDTEAILPATMAVSGEQVFFQNTRQVVCLDAATGRASWRADRPVYTTRLSWSTPTLVVRDNVVLSADGSTGGVPADVRRGEASVKWIMSDQDIRKHPVGDVVALSAETGRRLWTGESLQGFCSPGDLFVIGERVWSGANVSAGQIALDKALNLKTGDIVSRASDAPPTGGHTRCYRNKATERFLVLGSTGVEFVDVNDWSWSSNPWVRGSCQYGVMPCNGLLYVPPDSCACRPNVRVHGFTAMAPEREEEKEAGEGKNAAARLEKGPALGDATASRSSEGDRGKRDWPTYRHDGARSGRTQAAVSEQVGPSWTARLGGRLSALTVAAGKVYVAQVDSHTICALDAETGDVAWRRTVGGRVDSPPTISRGLAVFGCRDGNVYCLRASDGQLAWRFRAAPGERLLLAREQVESVWPVHGSVLVRDGLVWLAAGRSSYLDGGMRLYALRLQSGQPVVDKQLDGRDPQSWFTAQTGPFNAVRNRLPGTRPDILSSSGDRLFMGWTCLDSEGELVEDLTPHLFTATGFLDDTWWHRTYWQYGAWMRGGFGGWPKAARQVPAGRLLAIREDTVYGFGREEYDSGNPEAVHAGHIGVIKDTYQDSGRVDHSQNRYQLFATGIPDAESVRRQRQRAIPYHWRRPVELLVRAMLLADRTLWIAGPNVQPDNKALAELQAVRPGRLAAVAADNGRTLASYDLAAAPILDGMAATSGRLYVSCTDGAVRCLTNR